MTRVGRAISSVLETGRRVSLRAGGRPEDAGLLAWRGGGWVKEHRGRQRSPASEGTGPADALALAPHDHSGRRPSRTVREHIVVICYSREGKPRQRVCPGGLGSGFSHWASCPAGVTGATSLWVQQGHLTARGCRV